MLIEPEEIKKWVLAEPEAKNLGNEAEVNQVVRCLHHIVMWYNSGYPIGDFLTAVIHNDFIKAVCRADDINVKVLPIYARFLYNIMPRDYQDKIGGTQTMTKTQKPTLKGGKH